MPRAWSRKDERQYQHVKDSEKQRGVSEDRVEEIAARTVNKHRRENGRTPNTRTQGTGNPNAALSDLSRDELYNRAKERGVKGRSGMSKAELVAALGR
ncbi:addiction module toxin RelE [Deinococcus sp. KSM4-11]|uniref:Rho termination factor N-terminal domain-containing protein n=1 Tax=Deinococcus sp. KSM4-11 TaxID=2568654 RepID=UPI0010A2BB24|nr:Rho termination factor N-terminal domain-containing protein [Deinococcus sp. KSM4-11]THF83982.1 addiction module toxin RelE [Deinococcus sp. KSM4-11]